MKLLAITGESSMKGGSNRSFLTVLKGLKEMYGYKITVIVPQYGLLCEELDKVGIEWEKYSMFPVSAIEIDSFQHLLRYIKYSACNFMDYVLAGLYVCRYGKSLASYDFVYVNDNPTYFGAILAKYCKKPYIWHFRSDRDEKAAYTIGSKALFTKAKKIVCISDSMKNQYSLNKVYEHSSFQTIYNAIPLEPCIRSIQDRSKGFHIIICGRISEFKGQLDAVKAVSYLVNNYNIKDVFLHIVGEVLGKDAQSYKKKIDQFISAGSLTDNVIFEGYRNDLCKYRGTMNCELICSIREPFGRVTVEGMRSGLIIIGANTGGTVEIIKDDENGMLYSSGDSVDLAKKIRDVYIDVSKANRLAETAFYYGTSHFSVDQLIVQIDSLFRE